MGGDSDVEPMLERTARHKEGATDSEKASLCAHANKAHCSSEA